MRLARNLMVCLGAAALALAGADLTGKWSGAFDCTATPGGGPSGGFYLNLQQDGTQVTGTMQTLNDKGEGVPIENGRLDGERFTFEGVPPNNPRVKLTLRHRDGSLRGKGTPIEAGKSFNCTFELTKNTE